MHPRKFQLTLLLSLLILLALACGTGATGGDGALNLTQTAIAATLTAVGGEPPAAATTAAPAVSDTPAPALSDTPAPDTATPEPTATPTVGASPTATPTVPIISVSSDTNCRYGPGIIYDPPVLVFRVGETAEVYGRNAAGDFYYISRGCWIWTNYVVLIGGNLSAVPVLTAVPTPTPVPTSPSGVWHGTWDTLCGVSSCETMTLTQNGNSVTGTYANGAGAISGTVSGSQLTGTWTRNGVSGTIDFWMGNSGVRWRGNWDTVNEWCGARPGETLPSPCGVASWYGAWETDCGVSNCDTMTLSQDGTLVTGTYAGGDGEIEAEADGVTLIGTWFRNNTSGDFTFYMLANGNQFQGNFGGTFAWCGYRNGVGLPNPCLKAQ
jgi:hypothetical protein